MFYLIKILNKNSFQHYFCVFRVCFFAATSFLFRRFEKNRKIEKNKTKERETKRMILTVVIKSLLRYLIFIIYFKVFDSKIIVKYVIIKKIF